MLTGNEPAMPTLEQTSREGWSTNYGLTKREHFAAMAMQGLASHNSGAFQANGERHTYGTFAKTCVDIADALIAELNK